MTAKEYQHRWYLAHRDEVRARTKKRYWGNRDAILAATRTGRYIQVDESVFDTVTEESAYWIGFLMADGCIDDSGGSRVVRLELADVDLGHLLKFKEFLKSDSEIRTPKNRSGGVRIKVGSNRLAEALSKYGVTPRKTYTAKVIGLEDNRDFWRGAVDGDGSIWFGKKGYTYIELAGSEDLVRQFGEFVLKRIPVCKAVPMSHGATFVWRTGGRTAEEVVRILYEGCSVALDRKREKADQIIGGMDRYWNPTKDVPLRGSLNGNSVLSLEQVQKVIEWNREGVNGAEIGRRIGSNRSTVSNILTGKTWWHETGIHPVFRFETAQ